MVALTIPSALPLISPSNFPPRNPCDSQSQKEAKEPAKKRNRFSKGVDDIEIDVVNMFFVIFAIRPRAARFHLKKLRRNRNWRRVKEGRVKTDSTNRKPPKPKRPLLCISSVKQRLSPPPLPSISKAASTNNPLSIEMGWFVHIPVSDHLMSLSRKCKDRFCVNINSKCSLHFRPHGLATSKFASLLLFLVIFYIGDFFT